MESIPTIEEVTAYWEIGIMATTVYLSVISGYLIVAYNIGSKLAQSQLIIISSLFGAFALIFSFGSYSFFNNAITLSGLRYGEILPIAQFLPAIAGSIELAGIVAALKFMKDVRRAKNAS